VFWEGITTHTSSSGQKFSFTYKDRVPSRHSVAVYPFNLSITGGGTTRTISLQSLKEASTSMGVYVPSSKQWEEKQLFFILIQGFWDREPDLLM
jgi:hypothetical protein